jgi:hypothetical protein
MLHILWAFFNIQVDRTPQFFYNLSIECQMTQEYRMLGKNTLKGKSAYQVLTMSCILVMISAFGCRKKEPPQGARQEPSTGTKKPAPAPDRVYEPDTAEKIDLRILYAGVPNTELAADFVDFLAKHFEQVETADYNAFKEGQSSGFDVVILDYDGVGFNAPRPSISREYSRATVTMGVPGAFVCSSLSLKTGYL